MRRLLPVLLLILSCLIGGAGPAAALAPDSLVIEDTAGLLDDDELVAALESTDFRHPTTVLLYTYNTGTDADPDRQLLEFVQTEHPDWISGGGRDWADGLFVFVIDAASGSTGTYTGRDRVLSAAQQDEIRAETVDLFREGRWTEGAATAVREAADLINQPWYASDQGIGAMAAAFLAGLVWLRARFVRRRARRAKNAALLREANAAYAAVSLDLEATEVNARTIPADSRYGSQVMEQYRIFTTRYRTATERGRAAAGLRDLGKPGSTAVVAAYADAARGLDRMDDVISDANCLLNRAPGWERAWDRQTAPFYAELDALAALLNRDATLRNSPAGSALLGFPAAARQDLVRRGAELSEGSITPDAALESLRAARSQLADLLARHPQAASSAPNPAAAP